MTTATEKATDTDAAVTATRDSRASQTAERRLHAGGHQGAAAAPTSLQDARIQVEKAAGDKESAAETARAAAAAAKADPDNDALADEARTAKNAQRRAARALKKAQDALAEVEGAAGEQDDSADGADGADGSELEQARAELARLEAEQEELAATLKDAEAATKADPDNKDLFSAARKARWNELKAGKAVQKAAAKVKELAPAEAEEETDTGTELEHARAELTRLEAEQEELAATLKDAEAATAADPDNKDLFSAARKARWNELKAGKAVQKAAAKVKELGGSVEEDAPAEEETETAPAEPAAETPAAEPKAEAAPAEAAAGGNAVADAQHQLEEAEKATAEAEAAAETDPDDKKLAATARRARSAERKAKRALKKANEAAADADEAGDESAPAEAPAEAPAPAAAAAAPAATIDSAAALQDTLSLVRAGASVLAVAADAAERSAAAEPDNEKLAESARTARAAQQQSAEALRAAELVHGIEAETDAAAGAAAATATEAEAEETPEPAPEEPYVTSAREELARVEAEQEELAEATKFAEAATEADPDNKDLFSAARKARWNELKAGKAVQKASKALDEAIADAPPAPKVLTEEEKDDRRAPKPQGQWLVDGKEPLNNDERIKHEDAGLAVADRVREIYSKQGFDSIPAEDLAPRFKWIGMYTQRRQDMDGEQTSLLTNAELQDRYFMMRIRLDGGVMSSEQMRVIGGISSDFARGSADFTDRQNIQLHWIRIEDVPEIWDRLASVNLDTFFGCGDVPRVILGSPVAGIAKDEIIDATPAIEEIKKNWLTRDEFSNLPRKFKTAISGSVRQDVTHEIQDIAFIGSEHPEHGPGFDLWVGGGLSTNPMFSQRVGAWVPLEDVPKVWAGVVRIFRDYGYRKLRNRARLKFLVADWGIEKFRRILEDDYLGRKLIDGPAPEINPGYRDHVGVHQQRNGLYYVGVKPTVGHTEGDQMQRLADLAEAHGITNLRTTPDKELLFLDVEEDRVDALLEALEAEELSAKPSSFRRDIISCTGLEYCKLALVTTKQRAIKLADQLEERLDDLDVPLKISLNGCPNSCARTQVADIGLKGQIVTDDKGNRVEGFQVHLGGAVGMHPDWGKKLRGHKVTSAELDDYVVRVVENYKKERSEGEQFRDWVLRADEAVLQ
jgi:sulfite reductase (ferredoxin)